MTQTSTSFRTPAFEFFRLGAIALLALVAFVHPLPGSTYILVRWIVFGVAGWGALIQFEEKRLGWGWAYVALAVIFNPIVPFHLGRHLWLLVDVLAAVLLLAPQLVTEKAQVGREDR